MYMCMYSLSEQFHYESCGCLFCLWLRKEGGRGEGCRVLVSVKYDCIPTVCVQEFLALVEENDALQRKMAVSASYHT